MMNEAALQQHLDYCRHILSELRSIRTTDFLGFSTREEAIASYENAAKQSEEALASLRQRSASA